MKIFELHTAIAAVAPINGIASDGSIDFLDSATDEQILHATAIMAELLPELE